VTGVENESSAKGPGIKRSGPPQVVQKVRDNYYLIQIPISGSPGGDWRRLFYEAQTGVPAEFPPRSVEITGTLMRFRSDGETVPQKIQWIDRWIERASQKEAALGIRNEEQRRRREEQERETAELAELNARWSNL
jgi:hypothetical protein